MPFCAIAIANSQTIDEYQYEYERNRALLEVLHDMFEEQTDLDRIIFRIMIKAQELLKCQRCSILINLEPNESVSDLDIDDTGDNAGGAAVTRRAFDLFQNGNRPSQRRHRFLFLFSTQRSCIKFRNRWIKITPKFMSLRNA